VAEGAFLGSRDPVEDCLLFVLADGRDALVSARVGQVQVNFVVHRGNVENMHFRGGGKAP